MRRRRNVRIKFNRKPEGKGHFREKDVHGKMIMKYKLLLKELGMKLCTEFVWPWMEISGGLLLT
jgi:hypothetical protein